MQKESNGKGGEIFSPLFLQKMNCAKRTGLLVAIPLTTHKPPLLVLSSPRRSEGTGCVLVAKFGRAPVTWCEKELSQLPLLTASGRPLGSGNTLEYFSLW